MAFRGVPNKPRVGREQRDTLNRLAGKMFGKHGYVPTELSMQVAVQDSTTGVISERYDVPMAENPAEWAWTNTGDVVINGIAGTIDTAVFYHASYDEPLMKMTLDLKAIVGPMDTITFGVGQIRLSGDAIGMFHWPPEDYLIEELEEP